VLIHPLAVLLQLAVGVVVIKLMSLALVEVLVGAVEILALVVLAIPQAHLPLKVVVGVMGVLLAEEAEVVVQVLLVLLVLLLLAEQVAQARLIALQALLQPTRAVAVAVHTLLLLAVLVAQVAAGLVVLVWQLRNPLPAQTALETQVAVAVVQAITLQILQVTAATAALAS
jgi:hypothetical protein